MRTPPRAAQALAQANATIRLRSTATPARRADSALTPIALICWPCTVQFNTSHRRMRIAAMIRMRCGTPKKVCR